MHRLHLPAIAEVPSIPCLYSCLPFLARCHCGMRETTLIQTLAQSLVSFQPTSASFHARVVRCQMAFASSAFNIANAASKAAPSWLD